MLKTSFFLCVTFVFISTVCYSKYNTSKLGEAAGAYLCAVDMFERLSDSECGYIIKKKYNFDEALDEILTVFNNKDKNEMIKLVKEGKLNNMFVENDEFIDGFLREGKKDGLDENTLCGMIAQNIALIYNDAHSKWIYAVSNYSK